MTVPTQLVIQHTQDWINEVVIGLNLCPFAAPVVSKNLVNYNIVNGDDIEQHLHQLANTFEKLDENKCIETSLIIFPQAYTAFDDYLELLHLANLLVEDFNYLGTYQLASFHPDYRFEGSTENDASNYTNRSPYPMLHLLRESSIEKAVASYENIEAVPENNIKKLQEIGYQAMQQTLKHILQAD